MRRLIQSTPLIAILLSILLHGAILVPAVGWLGGSDMTPPPAEQGSIELLPVEVAGADALTPSEAEQAVNQEASTVQPVEPPPATDIAEADEPRDPTPVAEPPRDRPPRAAPAAAPSQESTLAFHLSGTDSASNAVASGDQLIPASPDDTTRNRPPVYPREAALRREQGTVVVLIRVSPMGLAEGAEVVASSGHPSLDQAAVNAVLTWRFRPAVRDGRAIPFEMPMRIVFAMR